MMAELPSNVLAMDDFLPYVSGVSIGSNDLTQLILGIDRDSPKLAGLLDMSAPAVLAAVGRITRVCRARDVPVSICGDAPSRQPRLIERLSAYGLSSISVPADAFENTCQLVSEAESRLGIAPRKAAME